MDYEGLHTALKQYNGQGMILFLLIDGQYTTYGDDLAIAMKILGKGTFPASDSGGYMGALIRAGHKVGLVDNPQPMK
jgi:hypothetical protein